MQWARKGKDAFLIQGKIMLMVILHFIGSAHAEDASKTDWWGNTKTRIGNIAEQASWDIYLSGYAYHGRETYNGNHLKKLNEKAWGIGVGKTWRNAQNNDESLYAMVVEDSNSYPQWMAGYAYQWIYPITESGVEAGAGFTASVIRRADWFEGWPFPALLPIASIGTRNAKLFATYVPRISTRKGKGDVLLLFARFEF